MSHESLLDNGQKVPSERIIQSFYDTYVVNRPEINLRFEDFQRLFQEKTHRRLPKYLGKYLSLDTCNWVGLTAGVPYPFLFIAARQEGSDTVTTQLSDTNICLSPSGNGDRPDQPYLIKFTGVAKTDYEHQQMIVSASYLAESGALLGINFSASSKNLPNPLGDVKPNTNIDYTGSSFQAFNQLVRPIERYMRSPFEGGIVTPAMVEATNSHTHMLNLFVPSRYMDPNRPFSIYENPYTPEIILYLHHNQELGTVCVGQIQSDLEEWHFIVEDHLEMAS